MTTEEKFAALQEKLEANEEFAEKFINAGNPAAASAVAVAEGIEVSEEELIEAMKQGKALLQEKGLVTEDGELSAEMLDMVAGGKNWKAIIGGVLLVAGGALTADPGIAIIGGILIIGGWNS